MTDALLIGAAGGSLAAQLFIIAREDLRTQRIPDALNLMLGVSGLLISFALQFDMAARLIGVVVGYAALAGLAFAYLQWRGRDGLGLGDAKLLAAGGAWIGWAGLPFATLAAAAAGLCYVAWRHARGARVGADERLAFGPFLAAGIFLVWAAQRWV